MAKEYTFTEAEVKSLHNLVSQHHQAMQNWIIAAVEHNDIDYARRLTKELATVWRPLFAKTNVDVHLLISKGELG
jgi:FAD/FMN-containing dehydrogenase